ncbi:MAG: hypothetical protein NXI02_31705, partial [Rhodobacteraceae bacterium]|nr:hypothetical protein [Paracoccaceae bacterium]
HADVRVHTSSSGFYAVTIAHLAEAEAELLLTRLKAAALVPSDAYLTEGARFGEVVWATSGAAPTIGREILLQGPIDSYAALQVARQISASPEAKQVHLNSEGGQVVFALLIARMIFNAGLNTYVPHDSVCFSACVYAFAAGRSKHADGFVGVHQMAADTESNELTQRLTAEILQEMAQYAVPEEVIDRMFRTPSDDMHIFSDSELRRFGWR